MRPKTLLINHLNPPRVDLFSGTGRCEPLNLAYLAAYLKAYNYPVEILDAEVLGYPAKRVIQEIKKRKPDIVGLSAVTANFQEALVIAKKVKKLKNRPITIIGGCHITAIPEEIKKYPFLDLAVVGEGEETLLELVRKFKKGKINLKKVKGIAFCRGKKLVINPPRPYIKDLDKLPFPARELLPPLSTYHPTPGMYRKLPMAFMITTRGCPYQCIFCFRAVFGNQYRARSPKNVVDEMEVLIKDFGVKEIRVCDDLFTLNERRVLAICQEILKRKLKFSWGCSARANLVTPKMLRALKKAGCWEICYGIESASQEILNTIKKGLTLETVKRAIKLSKESGLETRGFFMLGLPGDTEKTMQETIELSKNLNLDTVQFYITVPYPGTELYQKATKFGKINKKRLNQYLNQTTTIPPFVPYGLTGAQLNQYFRKAYREFFLRPSYLLSKLFKIRSPLQLKSSVRAFLSISSRNILK